MNRGRHWSHELSLHYISPSFHLTVVKSEEEEDRGKERGKMCIGMVGYSWKREKGRVFERSTELGRQHSKTRKRNYKNEIKILVYIKTVGN